MKASNKVFASVSGVCITAAVVIGTVLGIQGRSPTPRQQPAGNRAPVASTVTVTASPTARPTASVVAKVSPSKRTAVVRKQRPAAVVNQEPAVTDPTTTTDPQPAPAPSTSSDNVDNQHGRARQYGPTDAPSTHGGLGYPDETISTSP